MAERYGYDDAARARDVVVGGLRDKGMEPASIGDGVILGSGLGGFAKKYLRSDKFEEPSGPLVIPFAEIFDHLGLPPTYGKVHGHANQLVIGPMEGRAEKRLVFAQAGREHAYQGVDTKRATFWLRVMQLLKVETLLASNAAGIVTPDTLNEGDLLLVHSDQDLGYDNPLVGENDYRFGPQFPHMGDHYPAATRAIVREAARELGIELKEGMYVRVTGPNYEREEDVYKLRGLVRSIWQEAKKQKGKKDDKFKGKPIAAVGMSTTYENLVAQHATQAADPAFRKGRAVLSLPTNYAAALKLEGFADDPSHEEVTAAATAGAVQEAFGKLAQAVIKKMGEA